MSSATSIASSDVGLPRNSYIYKIISTAPRQDPLTYSKLDQLAIISSDDSLRFLDAPTLSASPNGVIKNANKSVTCLERANDAPSNVVATAGRDGYIRFWDKRSRQKALEIESRTCSRSKHMKEDTPNHDSSAQAHLSTGLRRPKELRRSRH
jgi:WD40 repeat protein